MRSLTTEQLGELTKCINERLDEWEFSRNYDGLINRLPKGVVRLVFDVIAEWKQQREEQHDNAWRELARELVHRQEEREQPANGNGVHHDDPAELAKHWPDMPDLTDGVDHFAEHPIAGEPMDDDFDDDLDDDDEAPKPKGTMTNARRQQLDNLKHQRRRKVEYERKASPGKNGNVLPTLDELIAEVQRLSMGTGIMPTLATFDAARPGNWATAGAHLHRLDMTWEQLAQTAELRPRLTGRPVS
jgi:hypothetical protein